MPISFRIREVLPSAVGECRLVAVRAVDRGRHRDDVRVEAEIPRGVLCTHSIAVAGTCRRGRIVVRRCSDASELREASAPRTGATFDEVASYPDVVGRGTPR